MLRTSWPEYEATESSEDTTGDSDPILVPCTSFYYALLGCPKLHELPRKLALLANSEAKMRISVMTVRIQS